MDETAFEYFKKTECEISNKKKVLRLEELCINVLVKKFKTFVTILDKEENYILKSTLQRKYSDVLFRKLYCLLDEKSYMTFLIQRHLQTLDLSGFSLTNIFDMLKILKKKGEGIKSLHFLEREDVVIAKSCFLELANSLPKSLEVLHLTGIQCQDEVLKIVTKTCTNLRELKLSDCSNLTDDWVTVSFCNDDQPINESLLKLDLSNTLVTAEGVSFILNHCPNITEICHKGVGSVLSDIYSFHIDNNIFPLRRFNLEVLDIASVDLNACLAMCPDVQTLTVSGLHTQDEVNICAEFKDLRNVNLGFRNPLSLLSFFEARGKYLERLSVKGPTSVDIKSLIQLCPNIEHLDLFMENMEASDTSSFDTAKMSLQSLKFLIIVNAHLNTTMPHINTTIPHVNTLLSCCPNIETFLFIHADVDLPETIRKLATINGLSHANKISVCRSFNDVLSL